jgi:hypothetical protein
VDSAVQSCAKIAPWPNFEYLKWMARIIFMSLRWADRGAFCTSVNERFVGSWRSSDQTTPGAGVSETKELRFTAEGRYTASRVENEGSNLVMETQGYFEAFSYESGGAHLVLMDDAFQTMAVTPVELEQDAITKVGKKYTRMSE